MSVELHRRCRPVERNVAGERRSILLNRKLIEIENRLEIADMNARVADHLPVDCKVVGSDIALQMHSGGDGSHVYGAGENACNVAVHEWPEIGGFDFVRTDPEI